MTIDKIKIKKTLLLDKPNSSLVSSESSEEFTNGLSRFKKRSRLMLQQVTEEVNDLCQEAVECYGQSLQKSIKKISPGTLGP